MSDLHYIEKGHGLPLVLLHAFPVDLRIWQYQIEPLSKNHRVIAIDLPGFGKSPASGDFTMDTVASDVHALLKRIDALPCALMGLSLGGYVGLAFYQHNPADIAALILADTRACGDTPEGKHQRNELIAKIDQCGPCAVVDAMMPKVLSDQTVAAQSHVVDSVRQMMEACSPETMKQALAGMRDRPDRTELLGSIAEPVLIIVGECDPVTPPEEARKMQKAMPHAELAIIPDASHYSAIENPSVINSTLSVFLARL